MQVGGSDVMTLAEDVMRYKSIPFKIKNNAELAAAKNAITNGPFFMPICMCGVPLLQIKLKHCNESPVFSNFVVLVLHCCIGARSSGIPIYIVFEC